MTLHGRQLREQGRGVARPFPRRIGIALLTAVFLFAIAFFGDNAQAENVSVLVAGGGLSVTAPALDDFGTVILTGAAVSPKAAMGPFTVTDARGTGAGWNLTIQASQFTTGSRTLALGSLTMPTPAVAKTDRTSGPVPSVVTGPYLIDSPSALKIASAASDGAGMGSYIFMPGYLVLGIQTNVYAGTYTSTVTVSVATGP
jgi:hypothetical protein